MLVKNIIEDKSSGWTPMFKKLLLAAVLTLAASPVWAQNPTCPTRPPGDSTNACASTAFVAASAATLAPGGSSGQVQTNNGSGGFAGITNAQLTALCQGFTSVLPGCVSASGGGTLNFLRADGTWVPAGSWTNTRLAKTTTYAAVSADCGSTIALGGTAFYTLTLNAASGYTATCVFVVTNEDNTSPTWRGKLLAVNGLSNCILWPGQTVTIYNDNNTWISGCPYRWNPAPSQAVFNIDPVNGLDTNDGLATGTGNALQHVAQCIGYNSSFIAPFIQGANCKLVNAAYSESFTCFNSGGTEVNIAGNNDTPASITWSGTIAIRDGCIMAVGGMTLTNAGGPALSCTQGSTLDTNGPIILSGSGVGIQAGIGCANINLINNITFTTNYTFPFAAYNSGTLSINGITIAMGTMTATDLFYIEAGHVVITSSSFTGTVTGGQWLMVNCGSINRGGATIPGSVTGNPAVGAALTSSNCGGIQ